MPDDFALDVQGNAYIATFTSAVAGLTNGKDGVLFVPHAGGGQAKYIVEAPGPTGAAVGRTAADCGVLYIQHFWGRKCQPDRPTCHCFGQDLEIRSREMASKVCGIKSGAVKKEKVLGLFV